MVMQDGRIKTFWVLGTICPQRGSGVTAISDGKIQMGKSPDKIIWNHAKKAGISVRIAILVILASHRFFPYIITVLEIQPPSPLPEIMAGKAFFISFLQILPAVDECLKT